MAHKGDPQNDWAHHLQQFVSAKAIPFWGIAALMMVLALAGKLTLSWALAGLAGMAAWTAYDLFAASTISRGSRANHSHLPANKVTRRQPLWHQMIEAIPDAALVIDAGRRVLAVNGRLAELQNVVTGKHISQLRDPELLEAVEKAIETDTPQQFEMRIVLPIERQLSGIATPLSAAETGAPVLLIVLRDRTEVERLAQMRADFVANASHELRTPLASLKGFIETLQGAAKNDPQARDQFLAIMQQQADRMTRLIEDLLSLSRIEMNEHVAPTAVVDVAEIAGTTAEAMQPIAAENGRHLTISLLAQPATVAGDRDQLAQVLQNLIQNAIKYGREHGTAAVSVRQEGERIALVVADDGIGIAPEHIPRLTERFYRVSAKESRERGGTGLGLAIVKHIVNRHRGELRVSSQLGKGSTFTVLLPQAERPRLPKSGSDDRKDQAASNT